MSSNVLSQLGLSIPITQVDNSPVTPADDARQLTITPPDGINPALLPDGFAYNLHLTYLPYRSYPMQLRMLQPYREQALLGMWQPRWYGVPQSINIALQPGETLDYELRVARGAVLWGYTFSPVSPATADMFQIQIQDICADRTLLALYETATAFQTNYALGKTPNNGVAFVLAPNPIPVAGSGDLLISVVNSDTTARQCQFMLMFLEPIGSPQ